MQIEIDARNNRAWLDGAAVQPRQQWLCAFLLLLVQSSERPTRRLIREDLELALRRFGRGTEPLHAKQAQRLVDGLQRMFAELGLADAFEARFSCEPACKTTGPWKWTSRPQDVLVTREVAAAQADSTAPPVRWLPSLTSEQGSSAAINVALQMLQALAHQWDGNTAQALSALAPSPVWDGASSAMLALRQVKRADLLVALRDFAAAEQALEDAANKVGKGGTLADSVVRSLLHVSKARLQYTRSPSINFQDLLDGRHGVNDVLKPLHGEVNLCGFADRWNLLMLCERRWLEANARTADAEPWADHIDALQRLGHAALFMSLAGQLHERAQNICANLAYAYQRLSALAEVHRPAGEPAASGRYLDLAMQWHSLSLSYRLRFDLPDNSAYEMIFLGELWLSSQRAREAFERNAYNVAWLGLRPDEPSFYLRAWECAELVNDPRQMAYCALNKLGFARHTRDPALQDRALQRLRHVLTTHPDLANVLADEGYAVPRGLAVGHSQGRGLCSQPN